MKPFFENFDWNSFNINILAGTVFFILSTIVSIKLIPHFILKKLQKKNRKYIIRKLSYAVQEICEYLNDSPFKEKEYNKEQLSIFTKKNDIKNYKFVGLVNVNVFNPTSFPKIILVIYSYFKNLDIDQSFDLLKNEKDRLEKLRLKLEEIIDIHSLHVDDKTIFEISDVCLDIRSFEIFFKTNNAIDDLIEKGVTKRIGVFGITDLAKTYERILILLQKLLDRSVFDIIVEPKKN